MYIFSEEENQMATPDVRERREEAAKEFFMFLKNSGYELLDRCTVENNNGKWISKHLVFSKECSELFFVKTKKYNRWVFKMNSKSLPVDFIEIIMKYMPFIEILFYLLQDNGGEFNEE